MGDTYVVGVLLAGGAHVGVYAQQGRAREAKSVDAPQLPVKPAASQTKGDTAGDRKEHKGVNAKRLRGVVVVMVVVVAVVVVHAHDVWAAKECMCMMHGRQKSACA